MSKPEIKNARIKSTQLGREDHGIMTFMIFVEISGAVAAVLVAMP